MCSSDLAESKFTARPLIQALQRLLSEIDIAIVQGDPDKPGPCLELIKWHPGHFSHPHYHEHARYAVVIDGTWWVSTSNVYDPDHNTVPFPKGSVLTDLVKGIHYDGAKPETGDTTVAIFMDCPLTAVQTEIKK